MIEYVDLESAQETKKLGENLAKKFSLKPVLIYLHGDLGVGKTTFVQGFITSLVKDATVKSPTYNYFQTYHYKKPLYHFDLYRIENPSDIIELGLLEFIDDESAIRLVEWPERLGDFSRRPHLDITFIKKGPKRQATISY
jgi:tRNA threonylcarbamoyladenosine biosynthesis protein TsaE